MMKASDLIDATLGPPDDQVAQLTGVTGRGVRRHVKFAVSQDRVSNDNTVVEGCQLKHIARCCVR